MSALRRRLDSTLSRGTRQRERLSANFARLSNTCARDGSFRGATQRLLSVDAQMLQRLLAGIGLLYRCLSSLLSFVRPAAASPETPPLALSCILTQGCLLASFILSRCLCTHWRPAFAICMLCLGSKAIPRLSCVASCAEELLGACCQ